jgi:hypothetical protein
MQNLLAGATHCQDKFFCRGCGQPLTDPRARFHGECRREDKRRRVRAARASAELRQRKVAILLFKLFGCELCLNRFLEAIADGPVPCHAALEDQGTK